MKIIAITGGVASGKNLVAKIFEKFGAKTFDADDEVHKLLKSDLETINQISKIFPQTKINNQISREILGKIVFENKQNLKVLEQIIHPLIRQKYQDFIDYNQINDQKIVILNIPLLLENQAQGFKYFYDYLVTIKCDKKIRKQRFIARYKKHILNNNPNPEIDDLQIEKRFEEIVKIQIDDETRLAKSDFVIDNNSDAHFAEFQVKKILNQIL